MIFECWSIVETRREQECGFRAGPKTMLKDVIRAIDYSLCAEVALALFCLAFAMMIYAVLRLKPSSAERYASIPLSDHVEDPRDE